MPAARTDVIDALAGIRARLRAGRGPHSAAAGTRAGRGQLSRAVRAGDFGGVSATERFAVGRVRHRSAWRCGERGVLRRAPCCEPGRRRRYGCDRCRDRRRHRSRPLWPLPCRAAEPRRHAGPSYHVGPEARRILGARLAAAFDHAHLLVFHPRDAAPARLQALLDAGWSTTDIVTLSQIIAFLSFQIRVAAGLRVLATA